MQKIHTQLLKDGGKGTKRVLSSSHFQLLNYEFISPLQQERPAQLKPGKMERGEARPPPPVSAQRLHARI